jgi:hypothetical protein
VRNARRPIIGSVKAELLSTATLNDVARLLNSGALADRTTAAATLRLLGASERQANRIVSSLAPPRINLNIPRPAAPADSIFGGREFTDWGRSVVQWGTGAEGAEARLQAITLQELTNAGITRAQAQAARAFYAQTAARDSGNAAAVARIQLMDRILQLLGG